MKTILLATLAFVLTIGEAIAQNANIRVSGTSSDISGQEVNKNVPIAPTRRHVIDFAVDNNTSTTQDWSIKRIRLTPSIGWSDEVCWGSISSGIGACNVAPNDEFETSYTVPVNAGDTAEMNLYITASSAGSSSFRYYVMDGGSKVDSVDLTISSTLGLNENVSLTLTVAPNPATNFVNINMEGISKSDLKIVDVLGNVVLKETIFETSKKVDVTKFKNGIYFITVEAEGVKPITRKLIIRH